MPPAAERPGRISTPFMPPCRVPPGRPCPAMWLIITHRKSIPTWFPCRASVRRPLPTIRAGFPAPPCDSFANIQCYDTLKVNAVVNWIKGKTHLGASNAPAPRLFGMNFQAVSVGQKLIEANVGAGGYLNNAATPTPLMLDEIEFVDAGIGQMVTELTNQHLLNSTLIIITAKHGQSPIDPHQVVKTKANSPANLLHAFLRPSEDPTGKDIGPTE